MVPAGKDLVATLETQRAQRRAELEALAQHQEQVDGELESERQVVLEEMQQGQDSPWFYAALLLGAGLLWVLAALNFSLIREYPGETAGGADGWREATQKIRFGDAMEFAIDLTKEQYIALHDGRTVNGLDYIPNNEFVIDRVGHSDERHFADLGIEYYKYIA